MATSIFRYLSPQSLAMMSSIDNTIIPVCNEAPDPLIYTDPPSPPPACPEPPPSRTLPKGMVANLRTVSDSNQRTKNQFRPRLGKGGATSYQLRQYAEVTLGGGSLRKVVKLPEGEDENEWLAVNSMWPPEEDVRAMGAEVANSGRFLQPDQLAVRRHHGVLLPPELSRDEGHG